MNLKLDADGFLRDQGDWNPSVAEELARRENVKLTDDHWRVLEGLRSFHRRTEVVPAMRPFVKMVKDEVDERLGTSTELMVLFGGSPAKMAAKIAGLPRPTNCL